MARTGQHRWSSTTSPGPRARDLHGMAATPDGLVMLTWLDLRDSGTRLYGAVSRDHGATWSADTLVYASPDETICQCCHPSVAADPDGGTGGDVPQSHRWLARPVRHPLHGWTQLHAGRKAGDGHLEAGRLPHGWRRPGRWPQRHLECVAAGHGIFLATPGAPERQVGIGRDPVISASAAALDIAWTTPDGIFLQRGTASSSDGDGQVRDPRSRFPPIRCSPGSSRARSSRKSCRAERAAVVK